MANPFLVVGGIAIGIVVATFGVLQVPGWVESAQDASAINDMRIVHDSQAVLSAAGGAYTADLAALRSSTGGTTFDLSSPDRVTYLGVSDDSTSWCGVVQSDSGRYFASSNLVPLSAGSTTVKGATLLAGCENGSAGDYQANTIVFRLDTTAPGCASPGVSPRGHSGARITWGDGNTTRATDGMNIHNYAKPGVYNVTVEGAVPAWNGLWPASAKCITAVTEWGDTGTSSAMSMFQGASNLRSVSKPPTGIKNMQAMFNGATSFNGDISDWDVSKVERMGSMFEGATAFNQDLRWDVSNVTDFSNMFASAYAFNGDISEWKTGKGTNFSGMFANNRSFTGDISQWDMRSATNLLSMFSNSSVFNSDLAGWQLPKVKSMNSVFNGAAGYYGDLSKWQTSNVEDMTRMFMLSKLNIDLSSWDVSKVTKSTDFGTRSTLTGLPSFR